MSSKIKGHFETLWAVKKVGFPRKDFCFALIANSKKVGKKVKKGPLRFLKNFFKFFANSSQQKFQSPASWQAVVFQHPPPFFSHPPPSLFFQGLPVETEFFGMEWDCHAVDINMGQRRSVRIAVYFFLANGDLQQRE